MTPSPHPAEAQEREAFEAWAGTLGSWVPTVAKDSNGRYQSLTTASAWSAWIARASHAPAAASGEVNDWFLSLPEGRRKTLLDGDRWQLAGAAFEAALAKTNPAAGAEPVIFPHPVDIVSAMTPQAKARTSPENIADVLLALATATTAPPATSERDAEDAELLFLFMGWLTSHPKRWVFSASDDATVGVQALQEFTAQHGISLDAQREQSEKRSGEGGNA